MNMKKAIAATVCAGMVVVGSVAGTMAYFTDTTDAVTNTFTVGNVNIDLGESSVATNTEKAGTPVYADPDAEEKVVTGYNYHIMPGSTYSKNVDVTVDKDSEECYVFVEVVNGFTSYEESEAAKGTTIAKQMEANNWKQLKDADGKDVANVYYKEEAVNPGEEDVTLDVFQNFTVEDSKTAAQLAGAAQAASNITVKAYAIQAEGFANAQAAWTGASSELTR